MKGRTHKTKSKTTTKHSQSDENQRKTKSLKVPRGTKKHYQKFLWKKKEVNYTNEQYQERKGNIITDTTDVKEIIREY